MAFKYPDAKIYEIRSLNTGESYIGSTTRKLSKRMYEHLLDYKNWKKNGESYVSSYKVLEAKNCFSFVLERFPVNSKRELQWILGIKCVNEKLPYITKEHFQSERKATEKAYRQSDKGKEIRKKANLLEHSKALRKAYKKSEKGKLSNNRRQRRRVVCECGKEMNLGSTYAHKKNSQKHQDYLDSLKN